MAPAVIERILTRKLTALRQMLHFCTSVSIGSRRFRPLGVAGHEEEIVGALIVLTSDASPLQQAAARVLIEYIDPSLYAKLPRAIRGLEPSKPGRAGTGYGKWRNAVFARDDRACKHCGATENLHAHHIEHWAKAPHLRLAVSNGLTLCQPCHAEEHRQAA